MIFTLKGVSRVIVCCLGFVVLQLFSACGAMRTPDIGSTAVFDISGNSPDLSVFEALSREEELKEPVIIKVPKGFSLPVKIAVNTPLATLENNCSHLAFKQDLFLYISNEEMLASPDTNQWTDISDVDGVMALFGGDKGEIAISIGAGKQKGAQLDFKVTVNPKAL